LGEEYFPPKPKFVEKKIIDDDDLEIVADIKADAKFEPFYEGEGKNESS
jgi:hypothetical protein